MATELTWRQAIDTVLGAAAAPLHYKEIAARIVADGLRVHVGTRPATTVNARICYSMKHDSLSPYGRAGKGTFALAPPAMAPTASVAEMRAPNGWPSVASDKHCDIVTSFGLCWLRDAIRWGAAPKLLGKTQLSSAPVDFNQQVGIYLLCDGREVVYIGRAADRRLGEQLLGHTLDRLAARWDRFSWFGLLPVLTDGQLGALPETYDPARLILVLQTILVEALEPRQNRRHVDELSPLEFIQREDPVVKRRRGTRLRSSQNWK